MGIVYDNLEKTALMATEDMKKTQQLRREAQERKQVLFIFGFGLIWDKKMDTLKEKTKNAKENVEELREMYEKIESVIGLDFESAKFHGFLDYIEKINDFQVNNSFIKGVNILYREVFMNARMKMRSLRKRKLPCQVTLR